jgi:hypothetical protein
MRTIRVVTGTLVAAGTGTRAWVPARAGSWPARAKRPRGPSTATPTPTRGEHSRGAPTYSRSTPDGLSLWDLRKGPTRLSAAYAHTRHALKRAVRLYRLYREVGYSEVLGVRTYLADRTRDRLRPVGEQTDAYTRAHKHARAHTPVGTLACPREAQGEASAPVRACRGVCVRGVGNVFVCACARAKACVRPCVHGCVCVCV